MNDCVPLSSVDSAGLAGGKAWSLARLAGIGVSVPEGFVLTTAPFERFCAHNRVAVDLGALDLNDPASFEVELPELRMPGEIRESLVAAWTEGGRWIVRSSAVGEDGEEASFAGQLDSVLDVRTEEQLVAAVLVCWRSYWSSRALFYQKARGRSLHGMGVIIQRMIEPVRGGVLFTEAPDDPDHVAIEWVDGHPSVLVDGSATPHRRLATRDDPDPLTREALRVEKAFGSPQDIEWVVDADERTWFVQSRPIVTRARRHLVFSNVNVNENYPSPISPLLYSIARESYEHYFRNLGRLLGVRGEVLSEIDGPLRNCVGAHGGRLYYNLTNIHSCIAAAPNGKMLAAAFDGFVGVDDEGETSGQTHVSVRHGASSRRDAVRSAVVTTGSLASLGRRVGRFERRVDEYAASTRDLSRASRSDLLGHLRGFLHIRFEQWADASLADTAATLGYAALRGVLRRALGAAAAAELPPTLLLAVPDVVSAGPVDALWELSRIARASEADRRAVIAGDLEGLSSRLRARLDDYVVRWGFRVSGELMLTTRTFADEPTRLLSMMAEYLDVESPSPAETTRVQAQRRERTIASLRLGRWRPAFRLALRATFDGIRYRERARLKQALLYSRLRAVVHAIADTTGHEVLYLTWRELDAWLSGHAMFSDPGPLIAMRRIEHSEFASARPPDTVRIAEGDYLPVGLKRPAPDGGRVLDGVGISGGSVDGTARVIPTLSDRGEFRRGDVLVARQTDPGWASLFFLASGLVVERGGMLSHGAIVAREFGIPGVIAVPGATEIIRTGEKIRVDGDLGKIHRLEPQ